MNTQFASISPKELHTLQRQNSNIQVIDVRTPGEYRSGHIEGAKLVPLDELRAEAPPLARGDEASGDPERNVYLTCQSGYRAHQAAERLAEAGHRNIKVVKGGTQAWEEAGLPMKRRGNIISIERQVQIAIGSLIALRAC